MQTIYILSIKNTLVEGIMFASLASLPVCVWIPDGQAAPPGD